MANEQGIHVRPGELVRTEEQQRLYVSQGKSKTMNSRHVQKLAIDLYVVESGALAPKESYKPLAEYWKSLHNDNVAGYDWGWDSNNFEMKP